MHAVIVSGGKQYRVKEGDVLKLEKLPYEAGASFDFEQVIMMGEGDNLHLGAPFVKNALVKASVVSHGRGEKIRIIKFRRRKHHMKRMGHRQSYTEVKITQVKV